MKIDCTESNGMRNWIRKRIGRRVCRSLVFEFCSSPQRRRNERLEPGQGWRQWTRWRHIGHRQAGAWARWCQQPDGASGNLKVSLQHLARTGQNPDQKPLGCSRLQCAIGPSAKLGGFHSFYAFHAPLRSRSVKITRGRSAI